MSYKKGAVEIQFNWIFIIIAGSVLLMFFVKVAGDYKSKSETEIATEVLDKIGSIASTGQLSSKSSSLIEVKGLELQTGCEAATCNQYGCSAEFDFEGRGLPAPTWMELEPVFASKYIRGGKLIMRSLDWNAPYKVTNFLYLTSADHKFVFVYDQDTSGSEDFARKSYNKFTENEYVEAEIVDKNNLDTVSYNGEDMIKFVFFFQPSGDTPDPKPEIVEHTWDTVYFFSGNNMKSGRVHFSKLNDNDRYVPGPDYPYYGTPMMMGAIYSDSINDYKCNVRKAMLKYIRMNDVYHGRSNMLENHYSGTCSNFYGSVAMSIENLNSTGINSTGSKPSYDLIDTNTIKTEAQSIEESNHKALENDCPRIY